ncbi:MAG: hypothetical protein ACTHJT_16660 [Cytophaga sp.]|uniref:hypothetical protein n=1 Tax=Cytophaga sp. TaxID=29535 RepID=UPI003F815AD6
MKRIKCIVAGFLLLAGVQAFSQEIVLESGDLSFLKNESKIRVEYDYSNVSVGEYAKEEDYIKMKVDEAEKNKPGSGATWLAAWKGDRKKTYEPAFEAKLTKKTAPLNFSSSNTNTNVTLIITVTFIEPGFYTTSMIQKRAEISVIYTFVDSKNPEKVLAKLSGQHLKSVIATYDLEQRMKGAYEKAAIELADLIKK